MLLDTAKNILSRGLSFDICAEAGLFPPHHVANAFFACGYDDLPGEDVLTWEPFQLSADEYAQLLIWWRSHHPFSRVSALGEAGSNFSAWFTSAIYARAA